jgi:hypothetical protein
MENRQARVSRVRRQAHFFILDSPLDILRFGFSFRIPRSAFRVGCSAFRVRVQLSQLVPLQLSPLVEWHLLDELDDARDFP